MWVNKVDPFIVVTNNIFADMASSDASASWEYINYRLVMPAWDNLKILIKYT